MAQYDVHEHPGERMRRDYPFVIKLQSDLLASLDTCVIAPLRRIERVTPIRRLNPEFEIAGIKGRTGSNGDRWDQARIVGAACLESGERALCHHGGARFDADRRVTATPRYVSGVMTVGSGTERSPFLLRQMYLL